jgi:hypothetical protein
MSSGIELYREVQSNESLRKWILDMVFNATYEAPGLGKRKQDKPPQPSAPKNPVV